MAETTHIYITAAPRKNSEFVRVLRQLSYNRAAMAGLFIFLTMLTMCLLAPVIAPYGYAEMDATSIRQGPSAAHIFGTDELGRDVLSRILYGGRYSITMGIFSVILSSAAGAVIGSVAGYFGGWVDNIIMRFLDIVQSLPGMLLTIVLSAVLGSGYWNTILPCRLTAYPARPECSGLR